MRQVYLAALKRRIPLADVEGFVAEGARMKDGTLLPANLIVLATGYKPQEYLVRKLFWRWRRRSRRPGLRLWRRP